MTTKTKTEVPKLLYSMRDAEHMLGLSARTIYALRQRGELRATRVGGGVKFTLEELQRYIAANVEQTPAAASDSGR